MKCEVWDVQCIHSVQCTGAFGKLQKASFFVINFHFWKKSFGKKVQAQYIDDCSIFFDSSLGNCDLNWKILRFHRYCDILNIVIFPRNLPNAPNKIIKQWWLRQLYQLLSNTLHARTVQTSTLWRARGTAPNPIPVAWLVVPVNMNGLGTKRLICGLLPFSFCWQLSSASFNLKESRWSLDPISK